MHRTQIYLPENQHESLRIKAFKERTSISEEIRKAIDKYLKEELRKEEQG